MIKSKLITVISMIAISIILLFVINNYKKKNSFSNELISKEGFFFDTYIKIMLYDCDENSTVTKDFDLLLDECLDLCTYYENIFSPTDMDSELYKLNNNPDYLSGLDVNMSPTLKDIIDLTISTTTPFYTKYSIYAGDLCNLWDISNRTIPSDEDIENELYKLRNSLPTSITLGASAKGYIADKIAEHLKDSGINEAIIDLGGNIVAIGDKYNNDLYGIGVKKPFTTSNDIIATVKVKDKSVVTSGIYERYFEFNECLYHHIIDVETGYPVSNDILSVTIIADNSFVADCYSTGCLLMGIDYTLNIINNKSFEDVECIIVDKNYNLHLSDGLEKKDGQIYLKNQ